MNRLFFIILVILPGCVGVETQVQQNQTISEEGQIQIPGEFTEEQLIGEEQNITQEYPPMAFNYNTQGHLLTVIGVESSASWDYVLMQFDEESSEYCNHDAPIQGPMRPGDTIHFSLTTGIQQAECNLLLYYNNIYLQTWIIEFEE